MIESKTGLVDIGAVEFQETTEQPSLIVTSATDVLDSSDNKTSLREAVLLANSNPDASTITFASGSGEAFQNGGTVRLTMGEIAITQELTIDGPDEASKRVLITGDKEGDDTTLDGSDITNLSQSDADRLDDNSRIFHVLGGGSNVSGPSLTLDSLILTGGVSSSSGGSVDNRFGAVTVSNSTISGNSAGSGGGGISVGTATVTNSTLSGNIAGSAGGGISADTTTVTSSTISGNRAGSDGGANGIGGGIFTKNILNEDGTATLFNTIVAGNFLGTGTTPDDIGGKPLETNSANNLIGDPDSAGGLAEGTNGNLVGDGSGNLLPIDQILNTTLADNGGPTLTHALATGSRAIDAGSNDSLPEGAEFDQRGEGFARIKNDTVDIGAFEVQAQAETPSLIVTTTSDVVDSNDGLTSLREAIGLANSKTSDDPVDEITFAEALTGTIELTKGELFISDPVTITGPGADVLTIDAKGESRIFRVVERAEISGLTLTGGNADDGSPLTFSTKELGGAIFAGNLDLTDMIITGNTAASHGGGIWVNGDLTLANSTISGNSSGGTGGGVYAKRSVTVTSSTISGNSSGAAGGGILSFNQLTLTNSTISGNSSKTDGGGISLHREAAITGSTITGNRSDSDGDSSGAGGGIFTNIEANSDGTTTLFNTIVAGNFNGTETTSSDIGGKDLDAASANNLIGDPASAGGLTAGTNGNLVGDGSGNLLPIEQILNTTLADNGGPTLTHALATGSRAIDAGSNDALPVDTDDLDGDSDTTEKIPFDQRGNPFDRVGGTRVDIGAFEAASGVTVAVSDPGEIDVTRDGDDVVIKSGESEVFRGKASTLGSLKLDIRGGGKNTVQLDPAKVLAISSVTETLTVIADKDDVVNLGDGWKVSGTEIQDGRVVKILTSNPTLRLIDGNDWRNPVNFNDVNADGSVTARDALDIINETNNRRFNTGGILMDVAGLNEFPDSFLDPNNDGRVSALDALQIINFLNFENSSESEQVPVASQEFLPRLAPDQDSLTDRAAVVDLLHGSTLTDETDTVLAGGSTTPTSVQTQSNAIDDLTLNQTDDASSDLNEYESLVDSLFSERS